LICVCTCVIKSNDTPIKTKYRLFTCKSTNHSLFNIHKPRYKHIETIFSFTNANALQINPSCMIRETDDTRVGHSYNAGKYLSCISTIQANTSKLHLITYNTRCNYRDVHRMVHCTCQKNQRYSSLYHNWRILTGCKFWLCY